MEIFTDFHSQGAVDCFKDSEDTLCLQYEERLIYVPLQGFHINSVHLGRFLREAEHLDFLGPGCSLGSQTRVHVDPVPG